MMRVAHVTPVFPPYRGGMGSVAFQQALSLAELGVEVTVVTPRKREPRSQPPGVSVLELAPAFSRGNAACLPQVMRLVADFDLVHLHYPFFGTAELLAARRRFAGPPLILQYQMDVVAVSWKARLFDWHRRLLLPVILGAADAIVVLSDDYAASSFLAPHLAAIGGRLTAIPAGIDLDHLSPAREAVDARARAMIGDGPVVFFLAKLDRAHYFKGLHVLIQALTMLPEARLVVGGDGEWRAEYETEAAAKLGKRARFLGDVPDDLLPAWYRAADVVALPSTDRTEAFGLVLVEAMACGTPVVATRLPGVRTLVDEGCNGYLVAPGDPIDLAGKLARAIAESTPRGMRAREFVRASFGEREVGQRILELYETLTTATPRPVAAPDDLRQRSVAGLL